MITLYTPATGYPELEAKLAYGLARVGLEAGAQVVVVPEPGHYRVQFEGVDRRALCAAWRVLSQRLLGSDALYGELLPAFDRASLKDDNRRSPNKLDTGICEETLALYDALASRTLRPFTGKRRICGHDSREVPPFGGGRLALALSAHVGVASRRDKAHSGGKVKVCDYCGHLAVLGAYCFGAHTGLTPDPTGPRLAFTLIPQEPVSTGELVEIAAAQRRWPRGLAPKPLPVSVLPLVFACQAQSLARAVGANLVLHTALYSTGSSGQPRIDSTVTSRLAPFLLFVEGAPFNAATVQRLVERQLRKPGGGKPVDSPAVGSLVLLSRWLVETDPRKSRQTAVRFARTFSAEMSAARSSVQLLYPATCEYMLGSDVMLIPRELRESESVRNLADMLRYFVEHRNYGYVDQLTRATEEGVRKHLIDALRQARSRRVKKKDQSHTTATYDDCTPRSHFVPLPKEDDIREVSEFLERDDITLEMVTSTLALLALTRRHYEGEREDEDVAGIEDDELPEVAEEAE